MPREDATINLPHLHPIYSFMNAMQETVKSAYRRRKAADMAAQSQPRSSPFPVPVTPPSSPIPLNLSEYSSPAVPDSAWCSLNFMLGAGMVILQPSTHQIVVLYEREAKYWFFPKGRKDIGESLETTAIREAYEESGYEATFLPLYTSSRAPAPPGDRFRAATKNTEPVFLSMMSWRARSAATHPHRERPAGEYLTTWYVGQIPEDAEYKSGTGMPDEQNYETFLMTYDEAMERLNSPYRDILRYVWIVYVHTLHQDQQDEIKEQQRGRRSINRISQKQPQEKTGRHSHQ